MREISITIDRVMTKRGRTVRDLAKEVDLSETQLSLFKNGHVKGIRFSTLARLCEALDCRPGDILDLDTTAGEG